MSEKDKNDIEVNTKTLRELAELKILKAEFEQKDLNVTEIKEILHELQVHQIELEVQNDELRRIQLALEDSREKYYNLFNFAPVGYVSMNEEHLITTANLTAANLLGITKPDVRNKPFTDFIFRDDQDLFYLKSKSLFETKAKQQIELRMVKSDGTFFWARVEAVFSEKEDNSLLLAITDISEHKKDEYDKQNSLVLLDATLESIFSGILVVGNDRAIIKTNKRFSEIWNVPQDLIEAGDSDKLLAFVIEQLLNPDEFIEKVKNLYAVPEAISVDMINLKDGRVLRRISKPLLIDGKSVGKVWSFYDITDVVRSEEKIKQKNEELIKINAEKDKFFSIIAHDLRGPFTGFLGFTEILKSDINLFSIKELHDIADRMNNSANNLFGLLNNLLDWSMSQRGLKDFKPEKILLEGLVLEVKDYFVENAKKKEIKIEIEIEKDVFVTADKWMLNCIIRNLVANAIKFTKPGGLVKISANKYDDHIAICVKDTGIGMSHELQNNLFKLDKKTGRIGTDKEGSSGLGLFLCKEFTEKHNGKIWVVSEENAGSEFIVSFPVV